VAVILFTSSIGPAVTAFTKGGVVQYDEMQFQNYADAQYRAEFGSSTAYEDNILIVFLTDEARDRYYCIAWVGDHLDTDVRDLFGGLYSPFGRAIESSVNATNYSYSLDTDLARAVEIMEKSVTKLGYTSNFRCKEEHVQVDSHLTNRSQLALTDATVNDALRSFTENTEIPIVIVVAEMEAVFGKTMPMQYVLTLLLSVIFVGVAIYLIVRAVKSSRNRKKGGGSNGNGESRNGSSGSENRSRYDGGRTDFH
jgi:hypothetical protein